MIQLLDRVPVRLGVSLHRAGEGEGRVGGRDLVVIVCVCEREGPVRPGVSLRRAEINKYRRECERILEAGRRP